MSAQPHQGAASVIDKTFTAVRAALFHPQDLAEYDAEYAEITATPVVPMAALDEFLTRWWHTAIVANRDRADWYDVVDTAGKLRAGELAGGRDLAHILAERGYQIPR
ncbi:DUF6247 family protein [Nonomuraea typhae]|uniref:DUF6247 family protein n=1 Tax=Nonomuraea typhae TaxID=2603600 RepID=A0ABW7YW72_9ACTN